ncbi:hypothetical protein J7I98_33615 [Streptomyces sp. ISL-98]|uniref:hypothetical protein n=1 Tax=Streptomyces sp. ISL-98 TaxID=2819192 RepID=UPI001BE98F6C|nr:hypothetical protein [Streptomyces sp. ISL-98]MBT2510693.1 hypothetical protein [Streptomyces sp. ISL-98]
MSSTPLAALMAEWDRCRWIWNESCAKSKQTHLSNKHRLEGIEKRTCGPAQLDKRWPAKQPTPRSARRRRL